MKYLSLVHRRATPAQHERFRPGPITPHDYHHFDTLCLSLDRGSVLVEITHDPGRCDATHYTVTLCSRYTTHEHTVSCSYLQGCDLATAADALLEAHRLIQAGLDPRAFTDVPLRTTATCPADDDSGVCSSWPLTTLELSQRTRVTKLNHDRRGGYRLAGSVGGYSFRVRLGGPATPLVEQLNASLITSLVLRDRRSSQLVAQFDGTWGVYPEDDGLAQSIIHHLCTGLARYARAKCPVQAPTAETQAPR